MIEFRKENINILDSVFQILDSDSIDPCQVQVHRLLHPEMKTRMLPLLVPAQGNDHLLLLLMKILAKHTIKQWRIFCAIASLAFYSDPRLAKK